MGGTDKKKTIDTVARKAGVSVSTVSRVMNNPEMVKEDKRLRVLKVMEELEYSPSPLARGLATDSLGLIGIIVPNITNQANARIVYAAMDRLEKKGMGVMLFDAREDLERELTIYRTLPKKMIDGVIVIFGNGEEEDYTRLAEDLPLVLAGPPAVGIPVDQLSSNEGQGFQNLVQYFYEMGHRDIAFLYGSDKTKGGVRRKNLFKRTMEDFGLKAPGHHLLNCPWTLEGGYEGAARLLKQGELPGAVISSSDQIAIGAMRRFQEYGLHIPSDISVAGFDNSPMARFVTPSLTSLDFPHSRMGEEAAELIIRRIQNRKKTPARIILPLEVVSRESTAPPEKHSG
ncbi:MAG: LacI family DNA-binding transcriptional regulator [Spirochaetales bacterium]|nr:LacI family DNA-binding transcriptional regulator [Spirochaetales bacterium]